MKKRVLLTCGLLAIITFFGSLVLVHADTIVHSFKSKGVLQPGLIVSLSNGTKDTVQTTAGNDSNHIYGVVIDPSQAPVTVQQQGQQVFVATGGSYQVLVSTEDGVIKAGDYITISSIDGIGTKANEQPIILGQALDGFDGKNGVITTADGKAIGRVDVSIAPGKNPLLQNNTSIPALIKRLGQSISGKNVSALRIWSALAIFVIAGIVAVSILITGIRTSITAIGRNPLSKKAILKGLIQVTVMATLVFIVGVFGVYLLLKV